MMNANARSVVDAIKSGNYRLIIDPGHEDEITIVNLNGDKVGHIPAKIYNEFVIAVVTICSGSATDIGYVIPNNGTYRIMRHIDHGSDDGGYSMIQQYVAISTLGSDVKKAVKAWCANQDTCDVDVVISFNPQAIARIADAKKRSLNK